MASKPNIALARFADQIGANLVSLTSGERDLGFGNGTPAASGKVNTELGELYKWALYLNDGALVGAHSIAGKLTVGGEALTFTDFTFTADSTTDQLAATGNPLQTGDGPVRVVNSGGGLPAGLAGATDYYWIFVDADHGRLATSRANAIAGTFIDITTNGTGTQTLQHQGGTTRVEDAEVTRNLTVDGDAAASGLLTAAGGVVVGANQSVTVSGTGRYKHGTMTMQLASSAFISSDNGAAWSVATSGVKLQGTGTGANWQASAPIWLPDGCRILAVRARVADSATGPSTFRAQLWSQDLTSNLGAGGTLIAQSSASAGSGLMQTLTISSLTTTITASSAYTLALNCSPAAGGSTLVVHGAEVDYDFP